MTSSLTVTLLGLCLLAQLSTCVGDFSSDVLDRINFHRQQHQAANVAINSDMSNEAQYWADGLAASGAFSFDSVSYGTMILQLPEGYPGDGAVDFAYTSGQQFYASNDYYGTEPDPVQANNYRLFAFLVWKSTTEIGIGMAVVDGTAWMVTYFNPSGGHDGQYADNVKPIGTGGTTTTTTTLSPQEAIEQFRQSMLARHNELRSNHNANDLQLDSTMNTFAQAYSQHLADNDIFEHNQNSGSYGENIASSTSAAATGAYYTDLWYTNEEQVYSDSGSYTNPNITMSLEFGHFTQEVWKSTTQIGIGLAVSSSGQIYVVANYSPAGNMQSVAAYLANVEAPSA